MIPNQIVSECRKRLLQMKQELMNRMRTTHSDLAENNKNTGDEADQSAALIEENTLLVTQQRARGQILEIELALARIEKGSFGLCEETFEPIETERLLALPWTRLSIEGAEIREASQRSKTRVGSFSFT